MKINSNTWALCLGLLLVGSLLFASSSVAYAATNFKIGWDPNNEEDIDGYGVYVRGGSPGPPYEHFGDVFLDELSDPDKPQVTLTEVEDGTYYIAATAFDNEGNESSYSDSLCVKVAGSSVSECVSFKSAGNVLEDVGSGGGGGGGGGCLITSAGDRFGLSKMIGFIGLIGLIGVIKILQLIELI
jgi:hypothetical protein